MEKHSITADYENVRLDKFVRKHYRETSLTEIFKLIRKGRIKVNGKKVKGNYRLLLGDIVEIFSDIKISVKKTNFIKLNEEQKEMVKNGIIYENENFIIFDKPQNMVVHKGTNQPLGLIDILKSYYKNEDVNLANRIDKATSGIIIIGKNLNFIRKITRLIREKNVHKYYLVAVHNKLEENSFKLSGKYLKKLNKVEKDEHGKDCELYCNVLAKNKDCSLLKVELVTGRTHQIRVQLSDLGHPILGDKKYGIEDDYKNMFLLSYEINFLEYSFKCVLPYYFRKFIKENYDKINFTNNIL